MSDEDFPHDDFRALGYHAVVHGEKGWNGVAVLSRTPAEADTRGLPGREDDGARLLRVRVAGLDCATAYCPNGKTRCGTTSPARTGTPRSSSAATSTSCRRRSTAGRGMPPTVRYSARPRSGPGTDRSSIWGSRTCFATCTRRNGSSPGGITGAARSTAAWAAHRPAARRPGRGLARAPRGDRPRVPQEEGRAHGVRSRAGVRGSGLTGPRSGGAVRRNRVDYAREATSVGVSVRVDAGSRHVRDEEILEGLDLSRQLIDLAVDDQNADRPDKRDQQREHLKDGRERCALHVCTLPFSWSGGNALRLARLGRHRLRWGAGGGETVPVLIRTTAEGARRSRRPGQSGRRPSSGGGSLPPSRSSPRVCPRPPRFWPPPA